MTTNQNVMLAARSEIDLFMIDKGYGCMDDGHELAVRIADRLSRDGLLP